MPGKGPFTVFAPTDAAFAKVPRATLAKLGKNKAKLRAVLLYHVVKGKVKAAEVMKLRSAKSLEGEPLSIKVSGGKVIVGGATVIKAEREGLERRHPRNQQGAVALRGSVASRCPARAPPDSDPYSDTPTPP